MPPAPPDFSVVIPVLDLKYSLELILRCLEAQAFPQEQFECVVVNDGSTDGTQRLLEKYDRSLRLQFVSNHTALGRGAARNLGWKRSVGEIVLFLDGDTLPEPEWISDYARAFTREPYDVVSGERCCVEVDPKQDDLHRVLALLTGSTSEELFRSEAARQFRALRGHAAFGAYRVPAFEQFELQMRDAWAHHPESLLSAYSFVGASVAVRRSLLEDTRGFDQFLRRGEDTDLGIRLWEIGGRFGFVDGARTYHLAAAGETNRALEAKEAVNFFSRHPYRLVLLVYLWFIRQLNVSAEASHPALGRLKDLAQESREDSNLDIDLEFQKLRHPPLPSDCCYTKDELIEYYNEIFRIPNALISECIDRATRQGLYVKKREGQRVFDFCLTSNWLRYQSPLHQYLIKNSSYFWTYKTTLLPGRQSPAPLTSICHGRYEISVDLDALGGSKIESILNIPLPVQCLAQDRVQFTSCYPADLLDYTNERKDMIPRYSWSSNGAEVRVSYEFRCRVTELAGPYASSDGEQASRPLPEYARPELSPQDYLKAKRIMKRIGLGRERSEPYEFAKKIYYWILDNTSSYDALPGQAGILDSGFGSCIDHSRLFKNLCRIAGIPARERCGVLFSRKIEPDGQELVEVQTLCYSPFMHTWVEFYVRGLGWTPVDFCSWIYGGRSVTRQNTPDTDLRDRLVAETKLCDEYFFGNLDPYRIHASGRANTQLVSFEHSGSQSSPTWKMRTCLRHRLECRVVRG